MTRIRLFVSSPGDCSDERKVLDEVVERINRTDDGTQPFLQLFKWEDDVVPRIGPPPQTVVDDQTPACDIYLGIMSGRFGGAGTRESGTEKEFRDALTRWGNSGQPWIIFYFNDRPPIPRTSAASEDLTRVIKFREELEQMGIVGAYEGVRGNERGFFEQVELHLRRLLQRLEQTAPAAKTAAGRDSSDVTAVVPPAYLAWLKRKCETVDLLGLEPQQGASARLYSIYVPLTTLPGADQPEDSSDEKEREAAERPTLLLDRLAEESLCVPGAPGAGKSTFCRWVAWLACEGRLPPAPVDGPEGYRESWPASFADRLPVLVPLREFWETLGAHRGIALARADLETALAEWLDAHTDGLAAATFRALLAVGRVLLILDGADEVPLSSGEGSDRWSPRQLLLSGLTASCRAWSVQGNRVLVTSRPYGLSARDSSSLGIAVAPVHDLDRPLRELLVRRWFQQLRPPGEREVFAEGLIAHLAENRWLERLSMNPLLLTGMCIVYDEGRRLPQDKHDLYSRIVSTVLHGRYRDDVVERDRARYRLQALAYGMHTGWGLADQRSTPLAEATIDEVDRILSHYLETSRVKEQGRVTIAQTREELLSKSGLFLGRGDGKAAFYHLSFQEFLAGRRIADVEDDVTPVFLERSESPEWHNTLSLLFAGLTRERAARLVTRLVQEFDRAPVRLGLQVVVADCLDIVLARGDRLDEVSESLARGTFLATMRSSAPPVTRGMVASTLGRLGDPRFAPDRWYLPDDEMLGFVEIPAGPLPTRSGTLTDDNDLPQHKVPLPTYHIARWPVTVAQFKSFVDDPDNGGFEPGDPASVRGVPNHPVVNVSWHEALLYCRWLTTRLISSESTPKALRDLLSRDNELAMQVTLPSEAEWQEATRGTNEDWGTAVPYAMGGRHAVGCFPDARSTYGVEEVAGNVWELTRTGSSGCTFAPDFGVTDWTVKGKTDSVRAVGGRLTNISLAIGKFVRSCSPDERVKDVGFRVVVSPLFSYLGPFPKV